MTRANALPFMLGIGGALVLFVAWLPLAVRESRRPYRWRETPPPRPAHREPSVPPRLVVVRSEHPSPAPVVAPRVEPRPRHAPAPRIAIVVAAFTVWSLWSLRGRGDHR